MGSISSGYTSMIQSRAIVCDRERVLARLQNRGPCAQARSSNSRPPVSSVLEKEASTACNNYFGKKAVSSGAHTLSIQTKLLNSVPCNISASPTCSKYLRNFPPPCPVITPKTPMVISVSNCQPSRFF